MPGDLMIEALCCRGHVGRSIVAGVLPNKGVSGALGVSRVWGSARVTTTRDSRTLAPVPGDDRPRPDEQLTLVDVAPDLHVVDQRPLSGWQSTVGCKDCGGSLDGCPVDGFGRPTGRCRSCTQRAAFAELRK